MTEVRPALETPSTDEIESRILEATIELAVQGGYDAVKQRDVALKAKVALATVYARFASKDVLLAAALELDSARWLPELQKAQAQLRGRTPLARVVKLYEHMTALWLRRPHLARAALRATTTGDHDAMVRMMVSQQRMHLVIVEALRGSRRPAAMRTEPALRVATVLTMVWFSNLTAWSAGIIDEKMIVGIMQHAAEMLLNGVEHEQR